MRFRDAILAALLAAPLLFFCQTSFAQEFPIIGNAKRGKELFTRDWTGKGLGPLYNAKSCVACHHLGGVGGAGGNESNALLLSVLPKKGRANQIKFSIESLSNMFSAGSRLHPALFQSNATVLHRSSLQDSHVDWNAELFELKHRDDFTRNEQVEMQHRMLRQEDPLWRAGRMVSGGFGSKPMHYMAQVTRRNTPSLFGLGVIESIPDEAIREIAAQQKRKRTDVRGRVQETPATDSGTSTVGKFGWRGQKALVKSFTIQACAVELGLSSNSEPEPVSPFNVPEKVIKGEATEVETQKDIDQQDIADLTAYITSLPRPDARESKFGGKRATLFESTGKRLFSTIRCHECHVEDVGPVAGVYSDFLLHDMGEELADAAGMIQDSRSSGGYFAPMQQKSKSQFAIGNPREWKTPPLWNVATTAPYLHDGRASDLHTAIALHGGEAERSRDRYMKLPDRSKRMVIAFLKTLK